MNIDSKAEDYYQYSTYNYVMNNPIVFVDPDGNWVDLGNGMYRAEKGDSASTLHTQHLQAKGYTFEQADQIVQQQYGDNRVENGIEYSNIDPDQMVTVAEEYESYIADLQEKVNKQEIDKIIDEGVETALEKISEDVKDTDEQIENVETKIDSLEGVERGDNMTVEGEAWKAITKKRNLPGKYSNGIQAIHEGQQMRKESKERKKEIDKNKSKIDSMKRLNKSREKILDKNKKQD